MIGRVGGAYHTAHSIRFSRRQMNVMFSITFICMWISSSAIVSARRNGVNWIQLAPWSFLYCQPLSGNCEWWNKNTYYDVQLFLTVSRHVVLHFVQFWVNLLNTDCLPYISDSCNHGFLSGYRFFLDYDLDIICQNFYTASNLRDLFHSIYPKWIISFIHTIGLTNKLLTKVVQMWYAVTCMLKIT